LTSEQPNEEIAMKIAVTGATGFLGRYMVSHLAGAGHKLQCWYRPTSDLGHFPTPLPAGSVTWIEGSLGDEKATRELIEGAQAVVHAALDHPSGGFRGAEGNLLSFVETNVLGTLRLIDAAQEARIGRFIFISSCAVHERILPDRPLDETHPLWTTNHYGAHKAAIEAFVHSYGMGQGFPICALRPTGIYGLAHPARASKWYQLIERVVEGRSVECRRGGKEVHAADVARAVEILLLAEAAQITGEAFNCYDRYISDYEVATITRRLTGSSARIDGAETSPRNQIATGKLAALGMSYGGLALLEQTIKQLMSAAKIE
jgi:nucleoside-diphosphate-sugar epimerase